MCQDIFSSVFRYVTGFNRTETRVSTAAEPDGSNERKCDECLSWCYSVEK